MVSGKDEEKRKWRKNTGDTNYEIVQFYSEVLVRRLLNLQNISRVSKSGGRVAVVYFEADWRVLKKQPELSITHGLTSIARLHLAQYYGVPVVTISDVLWPAAEGVLDNDNSTAHYSYTNWHSDPCCHPRDRGHIFLALSLIWNLDKEIKWMKSRASRYCDVECDPADRALPPPLALSVEEDARLVGDYKPLTDVPFMFPQAPDLQQLDPTVRHADWFGEIDASVWRWSNDTRQKYGLIAGPGNDTIQSHVSIRLNVSHYGYVELAYVASYNGFGCFLYWVDHNATIDQEGAKQCSILSDFYMRFHPVDQDKSHDAEEHKDLVKEYYGLIREMKTKENKAKQMMSTCAKTSRFSLTQTLGI